MTDMHAIQNHILTKLQGAQTLGDVYALALPHAVAPFNDSAMFVSMQDAVPRVYGKSHSGDIAWDETPAAPLNEAVSIINAFERSAGHAAPQRWDMDLMCARNDRNTAIICSVHMDGPMDPRMRVYLAASESPTWVVPHGSVTEILREHAGHILLRSIASDYQASLQFAMRDLDVYFRRAARRVAANTVHVMSGITPHIRDHTVSPERMFMRARGFNA